jgi:cysteine-rich repeat protein
MRHTALHGLWGSIIFVVAAASCAEGGEETGTNTSALTGAIFTTLIDGTRVNQNLYDVKEDVYLDGGPGDNAPSGAAALPEGDYYFQVTSPSGKTLLSSDAIECREFHINDAGVISSVPVNGCSHATGVDADHGGLTVQLFPYDDTPNPGGVYKVWVTNVDDYDEDKGVHGFIPADSKTDNFKVRDRREDREECCGNGILEGSEECDDGNTINGDGCSALCRDECGYRRTCTAS